jgi:hypothetical protein
MKRIVFLALLLPALLLTGCGDDASSDDDDDDDDDDDVVDAAPVCDPEAADPCNPGFVTPGEATHAWVEVDGEWVDQGLADWTCLGTPSADEPMALEGTLTITGEANDFQSGDPVPGAEVTAFLGIDVDGTPLATATTDDEGVYSITIPTAAAAFGTATRLGFRVEADETLPTLLLNQYFDPDTAAQTRGLNSVSESTANALPAFIGVTRTPGRGVLAGAMRDCQGREVSGAIVAVSGTEGTVEHVAGGQTYYFSAGSTSLPVRLTTQASTNKDGLFVVLELEPDASTFVQVWGFTDAALTELELLAQLEVPVVAETVITASIEPLRN